MAAARQRGVNGAWWKAFGLLVAMTGVIAWGTTRAQADVIELRGGGQVQGKVVPDPKNKDRVQVWLLRGRHPLSFQKGQIVNVIRQPSPLDEYVVKRAKSSTAAAQLELGLWCDRNGLRDLSRSHYETALSLDPSLEEPHRKLGHVYHDGTWLTRDDLSAAQGLVKYKGRWITAEEKSKREVVAQTTAAQTSWLRRIKLLRQAIINGPDDRRREAESQLMSIRDGDAVVPLVRVFGQDDRPRRILLALVLSAIGSPEATRALVGRVLNEPDSEVRQVTFDHLRQREEPGVPVQFARALASEDIQVINRAAWALGNLKAVEAVPRLVSVLITSQQRIILQPTTTVNPLAQATIPGPSLRAMTNGGIVLQSPPVVGYGVVAYGVSAVPWSQVTPGLAINAGISPGMQLNQGAPEPKVATFTYRNVEVLSALQKLTGEDFGYDVESWNRWVARSFNPNPRPARRVPQP